MNSIKEIWKEIDIPGYFISNLGRLRGRSGKVLNLYINHEGYYAICLRFGGKNSKAKALKIHREVAKAFIPNPNNLRVVNHKDGNKLNNCVNNLEWCTDSENTIHAYKTGLIKAQRGCNKIGSKLTEKEVIWIRKHYIPKDPNFGCRALAKKFNMKHSNISRLIHKLKYKD